MRQLSVRQETTMALTSRSSKKTAGNKAKRKMEYWSTIPRVMMMTFHLWNERLIFTSEEVSTSKEVFASIAELCSVNFFYLLCYGYMGLPWPFVFYALVEIVIRFFDTDCLYLYVCPWSKFDERKSLPWLAYVIPARRCKLLIWMISSFWWKLLQRKHKTRKQEETLMPDSDHRLQRINAC